MKKIITLVFCVGAFASSFAQSGSHDRVDNKKKDQFVTNSSYTKFDTHHNDVYNFSTKDRDVQINKINRDYNAKIKSVESNRYMKNRQKKNTIQKLQADKTQQIQIVNAKFNNKYNSSYSIHGRQNEKH